MTRVDSSQVLVGFYHEADSCALMDWRHYRRPDGRLRTLFDVLDWDNLSKQLSDFIVDHLKGSFSIFLRSSSSETFYGPSQRKSMAWNLNLVCNYKEPVSDIALSREIIQDVLHVQSRLIFRIFCPVWMHFWARKRAHDCSPSCSGGSGAPSENWKVALCWNCSLGAR